MSEPTPFQPTHYLVSKTRKVPVQLLPMVKGMKLQTELEFQKQIEPAFEIQPKRGFFCVGIPVLGYSLEPMPVRDESNVADTTEVRSSMHLPTD